MSAQQICSMSMGLILLRTTLKKATYGIACWQSYTIWTGWLICTLRTHNYLKKHILRGLLWKEMFGVRTFSMRLMHFLARLVVYTNQFERCSGNTIKVAEQLAGGVLFERSLRHHSMFPSLFWRYWTKAGKQLVSNSQTIETALRTMSPSLMVWLHVGWIDTKVGGSNGKASRESRSAKPNGIWFWLWARSTRVLSFGRMSSCRSLRVLAGWTEDPILSGQSAKTSINLANRAKFPMRFKTFRRTWNTIST